MGRYTLIRKIAVALQPTSKYTTEESGMVWHTRNRVYRSMKKTLRRQPKSHLRFLLKRSILGASLNRGGFR